MGKKEQIERDHKISRAKSSEEEVKVGRLTKVKTGGKKTVDSARAVFDNGSMLVMSVSLCVCAWYNFSTIPDNPAKIEEYVRVMSSAVIAIVGSYFTLKFLAKKER